MERKVEKYLKSSFEFAIEQCKHHYIVGPTKIRVDTAAPFLKAVDPRQFPDYQTIIQNPMDLAKIAKNIKNNKYSIDVTSSASSSILEVLRDMELIKNNCYTYNSSPESADIRVMADALRNYFRYLLRIAIKIFQHLSEPTLVSFMIHLPEVEDYLLEPPTQDVLTFIKLASLNLEDMIDKSGLLKQLGIKSITPETKELLTELFGVRAAMETPTVASGKTSKGAKTQKTPVVEPTATTTTKVPTMKALKRPLASMSYDENPMMMMESVASPTPRTKAKASGGGGQAKKRKLNGVEVYPAFDSNYEEDETALFEGGSSTFSPPPTNNISRTISMNNVLAATAGKPKDSWEEAADNVLKTISKHPYVDPLKSTVAANFFDPVIEVMPSIAEDYLRLIPKPIDISTIRYLLETNGILDAHEFYEMTLRVFQNAIDYNAPHTESPYAMKLVEQCQHLLNYCKWTCFETLPLQDDTMETNKDEAYLSEYYGELRVSMRDKARKQREDVVLGGYFSELSSNPYTECKKLLKDLERTTKKSENIQLSYFLAPVDVNLVADYTVYIRHPIDLSTIKYKLDGTEPTVEWISISINKLTPRYSRMGDFLQDLRKVFTNAETYNKAHIETDTTATSKLVYEAALVFEEKLENLLPRFTLTMADRIECARITNKELKEKEEVDRLRRIRDEEETKEIEQKMIESYKQTDKMFALDRDVELKKKQTEKQVKAHVEAKKMAVVESAIAPKATDEMLVDDMSSPNMSPEISPTLHSEKMNETAIPSLIYGYGVAGQLPKRFHYLLDVKAAVRRKAWDFFPVEMASKPEPIA
jgi:hypothetical protein